MNFKNGTKSEVQDAFAETKTNQKQSKLKNEIKSEVQNASMYWTRKENSGKQNHDNTNDKELTVMNIDDNEIYCIKDNSSWLTPGTPHPGSLSELQAIPNGSYFEWRFSFEYNASPRSHYEWVAITNGFHECWL